MPQATAARFRAPEMPPLKGSRSVAPEPSCFSTHSPVSGFFTAMLAITPCSSPTWAGV
jgi:hypothetical protein